MALLDTPNIAETTTKTAIRGEIRRRTTVPADAGIGIGVGLYDSSSKTNSFEDDHGLSNNDFNQNAKEQIRAGDETKEESKGNGGEKTDQRTSVLHYAYRPSSSAHSRIKESPLSSDAIFKQSHAGLFNLCIVVLVAVNGRLIIENLMKYGLLINSNFWFSSRSLREWPLLMCCLSLLVFPLAAYVVEKLAWKKYVSDPVVITLHVIITTTAILYPVFMILRTIWKVLKAAEGKVNKHEKACLENQHVFVPFAFDTFGFLAPEAVETLSRVQRVMHGNVMTPGSRDVVFTRLGFAIQKGLAAQLVARLPCMSGFGSVVLSGVSLMLCACINWLKLTSFVHTNYDMRSVVNSTDKGEAESTSSNIELFYDVDFNSLVYFMAAPTLCYQISYPRTAFVRKGWVLRQLIKLVIFTGFMGFIIEQYINPIVKNSRHPLKGDILYAIERVLKLSVPNLYVWLCMFYCFFHLWLNILAELLRFGDREFYKDWWNAQTIEEYWRLWNMPVHKWIVRHLYFPCLRNGIPKGSAVLIAFFMSAVFHELCIAVPCHIFKFWAFIGIMFQVGNIIFWCFFSILGQPMCVLLYYHDVMNQKVNNSK